jgi:hypothetical protein
MEGLIQRIDALLGSDMAGGEVAANAVVRLKSLPINEDNIMYFKRVILSTKELLDCGIDTEVLINYTVDWNKKRLKILKITFKSSFSFEEKYCPASVFEHIGMWTETIEKGWYEGLIENGGFNSKSHLRFVEVNKDGFYFVPNAKAGDAAYYQVFKRVPNPSGIITADVNGSMTSDILTFYCARNLKEVLPGENIVQGGQINIAVDINYTVNYDNKWLKVNSITIPALESPNGSHEKIQLYGVESWNERVMEEWYWAALGDFGLDLSDSLYLAEFSKTLIQRSNRESDMYGIKLRRVTNPMDVHMFLPR